MAYEGEILNACGVIEVDLSEISVVAVSGDGPNVCGHVLVYTPSRGGYYFHVTGDPTARGFSKARGYPMYMNEEGYRKYLMTTGKRELARRSVTLSTPREAYLYLESLMANKWTWAVLPNNCVSFAEEIIAAGGGDWSSYTNCPAISIQEPLSKQLRRFFQQMVSNLNNMSSVPRY